LDRRRRRLRCQAVAARCSDVARLKTVARDRLLNAVLAGSVVADGRCVAAPVVVLDVRQTLDVETQPAQTTSQPRESALLLRRRRRRRPRRRSSRAAAASDTSPVGDRRPEDRVWTWKTFAFRRSIVVDSVGAIDAVCRIAIVVVVVDVVGDDTLLLLPRSARDAVVELLVLEAWAAVKTVRRLGRL